MTSMVSRAGALVFSAIFALAFGLGGYFVGLRPLATTLHAAWQVRGWQAVPAQVLSAELRQHHDSDGGTTYEVRARYRYEIAGTRYEGERVGLDARGADNVTDWHQQWHRRLQEALSRNQPVTVWVNPAQPAQSLIDPEIRWSLQVFRLPFAFVFTGVGLVAAWVFVQLLLGRGRKDLAPQPGGDATVSGAAAGAPNSLRGKAAGAWLFALFWCGIAFPMAVLIWSRDTASGWVKAFISVFVVVGVLLLYFAVGQTRKTWRYRHVAFTALPHQPEAGRTVEITLLLPRRAVTAHEAPAPRLRLAQYRVDESSSGSPERQVEVVEGRTAPQPTPDGGMRLVARFAVPEDAPTHDANRSGERVDWRVELLAPDGAVELSYDLPVRATTSVPAEAAVDRFDRRAAWKREEPIEISDAADALGAPMGWPQGVAISESPQGWQLSFSQLAWRWAAAVALALLVLEWLINGRIGWHGLSPPRSLGGLAVAAALLAFALHAATRQWTLGVRDEGIVVRRDSWMWSSARSLPGEASQALVHKLFFTTGSGGHERRYHAIYTRGRSGERVRLTPGLGGTDAAVVVGRAIAQAWQDRRGRFAAGVQRTVRSDHSRPSWGWLVVLALVAISWWLPPAGDYAKRGHDLPNAAPARSTASSADTRLLGAQDAGDAAALEQALRDGANPDLLADSGSSVLMLAAHRGQMTHVELLLRAGAQPDLRQTRKDSERGDTALLRAFYGGHLAVAQRLARAGASLQVRNRWDWGPVHMAAQSGCVPCLQWLVDQGQSLEAPALASRGETPAMLAAAKGRVPALQWLQERGIDLWQHDAEGKTALDWARFGKQPDAERWLMERQR